MSINLIPQEIKERVTSRRSGSVSFIQSIDPDRTAILVVDMQNYFWIRDLPVLYTPEADGIVDNINEIVRWGRDAGAKIFWIQHSFTREWKSWYEKTTKGAIAEAMVENTAPGSFGFAIHERMDVRDGDVRVPKTRYSAMLPNSSNLHQMLQKEGIDTVIIVGALTNCCCESTARDAMMMDYDVIFVSDANATRSPEQHVGTLVSMMQLFADVRDTKETLSLVASSKAAA